MMTPNPFMDPFFAHKPDTSGETKADYYRRQRQMVRQYSQSPQLKLTLLLGEYTLAFIFIGFLGTASSFIFTLVTRGKWYYNLLALAIFVIVVLLTFHLWSNAHKIGKAFERLPSVHGGSFGKNRLFSILDWLDAHWPAEHPHEIMMYDSPFYHRWDWQSTYANRPVLLVVFRVIHSMSNSQSATNPAINFVNFLIAGSPAPPQSDADSTLALQKLKQFGYVVQRTSAGVIVSLPGIDPEKLAPSHVGEVLNLAMRIG